MIHPVTNKNTDTKGDKKIKRCQKQAQHYDTGKVLGEQMLVLSNIPAVEIAYTQIHYYIKKESKIDKSIIEPVISGTHYILNRPVNAKDVKGFN
jgi:hypothetical protein